MIGTDIVQISRFESFEKRFGVKALKRFLNDAEIASIKKSSTAAGYWAAKEAISKALGTGIGETCGFHDIVIYKDKRGAPHFSLTPQLIEQFNIKDTSLSIAHDGGFAIAVVVIDGIKSSTTNKV